MSGSVEWLANGVFLLKSLGPHGVPIELYYVFSSTCKFLERLKPLCSGLF